MSDRRTRWWAGVMAGWTVGVLLAACTDATEPRSSFVAEPSDAISASKAASDIGIDTTDSFAQTVLTLASEQQIDLASTAARPVPATLRTRVSRSARVTYRAIAGFDATGRVVGRVVRTTPRPPGINVSGVEVSGSAVYMLDAAGKRGRLLDNGTGKVDGRLLLAALFEVAPTRTTADGWRTLEQRAATARGQLTRVTGGAVLRIPLGSGSTSAVSGEHLEELVWNGVAYTPRRILVTRNEQAGGVTTRTRL